MGVIVQSHLYYVNQTRPENLSLSNWLSIVCPVSFLSVAKTMSCLVVNEVDIEAGPCPTETESSADRVQWVFLRKVYAILMFQLLLTTGAIFLFVRTSLHSLPHQPLGILIFILVLILFLSTVLGMGLNKNGFLLVLTSISGAFLVGFSCSFSNGKVILEAGILASVVPLSLTLYTYWAARRQHDFMFLGPFLCPSLLVATAFTLIQVFIPLGDVWPMISGLCVAIMYSAYILYESGEIRFEFRKGYVWAAFKIYLDILCIFLDLLSRLWSCLGYWLC